MGSSGREPHGSTNRDSSDGPNASPERLLAFLGLKGTTANLPPEFAQRMAELLKLVHDAQTRTLTLEEKHAVTMLIGSLSALLGADDPE